MTSPSAMLTDFITNKLNTEQQIAVHQHTGSLLVIAGAGSGKTRVITTRIANLILNQQVNPSSILALTFTNKAATEMLERITQFLGPEYRMHKPFIGTFHGYCLRLLKSNSELLEHPTFSILDSDDQLSIAKGIIDRYGLSKQTSASQLLYYISQLKNSLISPDQIQESPYTPSWARQAYQAYEAAKRMSSCFDFDDLLLQTVSLLKTNSGFKKIVQQRIRHILVDEYQDTNLVQHELLKQLGLDGTTYILDSLCAVGDEDQSIYSWRGAHVANMQTFQEDFAPTTVIKLEQNYRSVQPILEVANTVITYNKQRTPKALWSTRTAQDRIRQLVCLSDYQESDAIALYITLASKQQKRSSLAILYRTHSQSRSLEEGLIRASIPYTIIGGIQFYERKEIKDLLAYMRLIVNPLDRPAFFRILNCPARLLGDKFQELVDLRWQQTPTALFGQICSQLIYDGTVTGVKKQALEQFLAVFSGLDRTAQPSKALTQILDTTQYKQHIAKAYDEQEASERLANIQELLNAVYHLEQTALTVEQFLHDVALMQEKKLADEHEQDRVLLMTLHAAKGLEFHTVIITGIEEGLLPSSRSLNELEKIEEERRLLYVGITRAQERLLLTRCRYRSLYGKTTDQLVSRFVREIPATIMATQDAAQLTQEHLEWWFTAWLAGNALPAAIKPNKARTSHRIAAPEKVTPSHTSPPQHSPWKKNAPVQHAVFGIGIIQRIEHRDASAAILEIAFKQGIKKISADFITPL